MIYEKKELPNNQFSITFNEIPTSGYSWEVENVSGMKLIKETFVENVENVGGSGLKLFIFEKIENKNPEHFVVVGLKCSWNETVISVIHIPF